MDHPIFWHGNRPKYSKLRMYSISIQSFRERNLLLRNSIIKQFCSGLARIIFIERGFCKLWESCSQSHEKRLEVITPPILEFQEKQILKKSGSWKKIVKILKIYWSILVTNSSIFNRIQKPWKIMQIEIIGEPYFWIINHLSNDQANGLHLLRNSKADATTRRGIGLKFSLWIHCLSLWKLYGETFSFHMRNVWLRITGSGRNRGSKIFDQQNVTYQAHDWPIL